MNAILRMNLKRQLINATGKFLLLGLLVINVTCDEENPSNSESQQCPARSWRVVDDLLHDCKPYESDNFRIYSNASSMEAKQELANLCEEVFLELKTVFEVENNDELEMNDKFEVYSIKDLSPEWGTGYAHYNGFLIAGIDSWHYRDWYRNSRTTYKTTVKHEMTHVFQNRLCGRWTPVWFAEGLAEYLGGTVNNKTVRTICGIPITTLSAFNTWCAQGHKNPVSIRYFSDYPNTTVDGYAQYYPMFYLVMAYLLDPNGRGKTIHDIRLIFQDLKNGGSQTIFDAVFEDRMGISTQYYEEQFYEMMEAYL